MAYRASFNWFDEMVLDNGTVIRRIEQPGGGATFTVVESNVDPDEYTNDGIGEWFEVDDEETIAHWMLQAGLEIEIPDAAIAEAKAEIAEVIEENSAVVKLWWRGKTLIVADKTEEMYTEDGDQIDAYYELSFHEGMMPAYGHEKYTNIGELFDAMEGYAPLTDWEIEFPDE